MFFRVPTHGLQTHCVPLNPLATRQKYSPVASSPMPQMRRTVRSDCSVFPGSTVKKGATTFPNVGSEIEERTRHRTSLGTPGGCLWHRTESYDKSYQVLQCHWYTLTQSHLLWCGMGSKYCRARRWVRPTQNLWCNDDDLDRR